MGSYLYERGDRDFKKKKAGLQAQLDLAVGGEVKAFSCCVFGRYV